MGWCGQWQKLAELGLSCLASRYRRTDGLFSTLVAADGTVLNPAAFIYDQAFVLLAAASLFSVSSGKSQCKQLALGVLDGLEASHRHAAGGFREEGGHGFLSNPHMHLLEAALAWAEIDDSDGWRKLADEIAELALQSFIDPQQHFLREYFSADWRALSGPLGRSVEPGHQFEWAWLLERWSRLRGREDAHVAALGLFAAGSRGVDNGRGVAIDEMDDLFQTRRATARLWPQTERLKAALILMEGAQHAFYEKEASAAAEALWSFLQVRLRGLWRDRMLEDGRFVDEPAPASSLYHIIGTIDALERAHST